MNENTNLLDNEIIIDATATGHLKETAMWSKILAITGFVFSVLLFAIGIIASVTLSRFSNTYSRGNSFGAETSGFLIVVIYSIMAIILFICSLFLLRFAIKMKTALINTDQESFQQALLNQKYYFRITGIVTLLACLFMLIAVIAGFITAMTASY
ncbi:MAG: hypothetical protein JST86_13580 [Bacteroidetes bacterium]|nr:hypothetical protein [Bacteroidota bacterium]